MIVIITIIVTAVVMVIAMFVTMMNGKFEMQIKMINLVLRHSMYLQMESLYFIWLEAKSTTWRWSTSVPLILNSY